MTAAISWLDLTAADRDKVRRVLDLFSEQSTVDELGVGSLRDTMSNALFPGTSVLHTRLWYVLFIPWSSPALFRAEARAASIKE